MRVTVSRSGGVAGNKKQRTVDTDSMNPDKAQELRTLVEQIDFDSLDRHSHTITVEMDDGLVLKLEQVRDNLIPPGSPLRKLITTALAAPRTDPEMAADESPSLDAPFCDVCGHLTVQHDAEFKCLNCGNTMAQEL